MSVPSALDFTTTTSAFAKLRYGPVLAFLAPSKSLRSSRTPTKLTPYEHTKHNHERGGPNMDNAYITALVRAGTCAIHASPSHRASGCQLRPSILKQTSCHVPSRTHYSMARFDDRARARHGISQEAYLNLVDQYLEYPGDDRGFSTNSHLTFISPSLPASTNSTGPLAIPILVEPGGVKGFNEAETMAQAPEEETLDRLLKAIGNKAVSQESLYDLYQALPSPRVSHFTTRTVRKLLRHLSSVEQKNEVTMMRYLSVVDDVKAAGLKLTPAEYNSVMAFVGRCFGRVATAQVESALYVFKEMENNADGKANEATFNILLDIAAKGGKFGLAEMILREMENRALSLRRYGYVGLMYYYGLKGDGNGIRRTYRRLVVAGEVVDTVVLNCVIAALIQAGEVTAAEHVYERMKTLHTEHTGATLPPGTWQKRRSLGRSLQRLVKLMKTNPPYYRKVRDATSVAPNLRTYRILVVHHAVHLGELEYVAKLLYEMRAFEVPLHGSIFLALFKGFARHGGVSFTSWSTPRLEDVWEAYLRAIDRNVQDLYMGKWMVIWTLRAFGQCTNRRRTLEVWDIIQQRWHGSKEDYRAVVKTAELVLAQ
ncbi:MAG: hypothetical protein M1833_005292 [Piccolia ochrophora]|nr:MAG: hypothetical protein M1833_005292 [Piccolia ochrophora]